MTDKNTFTKLPYLILLSVFTLAFWYLGKENIQILGMQYIENFDMVGFGISLYICIAFVILIVCKNTIYVLPYILNILFMIYFENWNTENIPLYIYVAPVVLILGMVIHVIRYRTNVFKGKFFLAFFVLSIGMIISTIINTETFNAFTILLLIVPIFFLLLYGFFANTIEGDNLVYLIKVFTILGVLIAAEVFLYYFTEYIEGGMPAIIFALEHKTIDLGWGISNFVATYLIMFIATITYFVKKYKLHIFWILLALFEIVMLLFTLSRAGLISFLITSIVLVIFMFIHYEHKGNLILNLFIGVLVFAIIGYFTRDLFITIWGRLQNLRLDDSGRMAIYREAIQVIKANPIFGKGIFARSVSVGTNELRLTHNTILQILASFGILGGLSLLLQFIAVIRVFFYQFNAEKAVLLIAIIGANIHGMVDNTYIMPQYLFIMMITFAVVENANKIDALRLDLSNRG